MKNLQNCRIYFIDIQVPTSIIVIFIENCISILLYKPQSQFELIVQGLILHLRITLVRIDVHIWIHRNLLELLHICLHILLTIYSILLLTLVVRIGDSIVLIWHLGLLGIGLLLIRERVLVSIWVVPFIRVLILGMILVSPDLIIFVIVIQVGRYWESSILHNY